MQKWRGVMLSKCVLVSESFDFLEGGWGGDVCLLCITKTE